MVLPGAESTEQLGAQALGRWVGSPRPPTGTGGHGQKAERRTTDSAVGWKTLPCPIADLGVWAAGPNGSDPAGRRRWGA